MTLIDGKAISEQVKHGRARLIDGVGAASEDEADGLHSAELLQRGRVGLDLAIDAALAHPAGDELVVLAAEIQYVPILNESQETG